jgi:hypothetical protein|tara:strand:- start:194 stop:418 length:225 start_codon:yes stop_codon:yes gene_type:complete
VVSDRSYKKYREELRDCIENLKCPDLYNVIHEFEIQHYHRLFKSKINPFSSETELELKKSFLDQEIKIKNEKEG